MNKQLVLPFFHSGEIARFQKYIDDLQTCTCREKIYSLGVDGVSNI